MDRLASMITFIKVVEAGGFAAAGRKLGISPSSVTAQVQGLEKRLGARLLNRSTRRVSMTESGRAYYERCSRIVAETNDAEKMVQALQSSPRGTLRLNVSRHLPSLLAPVVAEFTSIYNDVKLIMTSTDSIVNLVEAGVDLAITALPTQSCNLITRRVGSFRLVVCGAHSYFASHGVPRQPIDLAGHNCLSYSLPGSEEDWLFSLSEGRRNVAVRGNMEANSTSALKRAAVLGQGLILMPDFLVTDEIESGKLIQVLSDFSGPERPINALYVHRNYLSASVRCFLELLTKRLRGATEETVHAMNDVLPYAKRRINVRMVGRLPTVGARPG